MQDIPSTWHAWPARGWLASVEEEAKFRRSLGSPAKVFTDSDSILVCSALRAGADLKQMLHVAPGLSKPNLAAAYDAMQAKLIDCRASIAQIHANPNSECLIEHLPKAGRLARAGVFRLLRQIQDSPEQLELAVQVWMREVQNLDQQADTVEAALEALHAGNPAGIQLGNQLYNPTTDSILADANFVARRVGELTPVRRHTLLHDTKVK